MKWILNIFVLGYLFHNPAQSGAVKLVQNNFQSTIASYELAIIDFYTDWCRHSQNLAPIFDAAANQVRNEFRSGTVLLGKVNCDEQPTLSKRFQIRGYPKLLVFKYGQLKGSYGEERSKAAIVQFIRNQL